MEALIREQPPSLIRGGGESEMTERSEEKFKQRKCPRGRRRGIKRKSEKLTRECEL